MASSFNIQHSTFNPRWRRAEGKLVSREELLAAVRRLRESLSTTHYPLPTVVFTNGCFDLLHVGHLHYLEQARALGDVLIVAVNSDAGVRRLKGPGRPLLPSAERARLIAALECVDYVTIFDEPDPIALISLLKPDLHVKGGDYQAEQLPETPAVRSYGGQVKIIPLLPGHSTSALLEKLR